MEKLIELLNYLESIIDPDHFNQSKKLLSQNLRYGEMSKPLVRVMYPSSRFKPFPYSETATDMSKMMYNELVATISTIESKDCSLPMIRTNYGVGTLPSLFGLNSRIVNENLPWVDHLETIDEVRAVVAKGIPDMQNGFGKKVLETYEFYNEVLLKFPKCQECIKLYHPDLQGPFDVSHLIMGSEIYLAIYDEPELVLDLMGLVTDTYISFMKKIKPLLNDEYDGNCYHWGCLFGGNIVLRDDSPVNLSLDAYREFVKDFDSKILTEFGSGSIHFCGRADQWVFDMLTTENLKAMNFGYMPNVQFGQKYIDFIMPTFSEKRIPVAGYTLSKEEIESFDFSKYMTGISYNVSFESKDAAMNYLNRP